MKKLIVYGSHYGSTQHYAQKFAELTDLPVVSYKELPDLTEYDLIIHFGGLYAGGVLGLKKTLKAMGT
ncbi:MAG TPA: flavodoxin domain-containing protein, partial [Candidatus Merdibacter merdigallinarum]|nr:flavodoxin domain-containing protein [Candidatus Merdibacter merdigallinarum]